MIKFHDVNTTTKNMEHHTTSTPEDPHAPSQSLPLKDKHHPDINHRRLGLPDVGPQVNGIMQYVLICILSAFFCSTLCLRYSSNPCM